MIFLIGLGVIIAWWTISVVVLIFSMRGAQPYPYDGTEGEVTRKGGIHMR
jgi:hypothetical protein